MYYIDFRGNMSGDVSIFCSVSATVISDCSGKAGYAFSDLNRVKEVIENFLRYNNYFVSTRNTIYNSSIPGSEIANYSQTLTTKEYVKYLSPIVNYNNNGLTLNVTSEDGTITYYKGINQNIYFGGSFNQNTGVYTHPQLTTNATLDASGYYYVSENTRNVLFSTNGCYKIFFTYEDAGEIKSTGTARIFCLDTTAPTISYKKDTSDSDSIQEATASSGTTYRNPILIESDFRITGLNDLDDYAFILVGNNRYPSTCSNNSSTCLNDIETHIKQYFRYNINEPNKVRSIAFTDRSLNTNTFYFIIGTKAPQITINNNEYSFDLNVNFYNTNRITSVRTDVAPQTCLLTDTQCYAPTTEDVNAISNSATEFSNNLLNYINAVYYRDSTNEAENTITVTAVDGVYTIGEIGYSIVDNKLVEVAGYEFVINLNVDNTFIYKGTTYLYNTGERLIQATTTDLDGNVIVNTEIPSVSIVDEVFNFNDEDINYRIAQNEEGNYVISKVPESYVIYNTNQVKIADSDIVYTIDFDKQTITYDNPELTTLKRVTLHFERTIKGTLAGGVDIPQTQPARDGNGNYKYDSNGNLIYEIVVNEGSVSYRHYNVVDGVYTFEFGQSFNPQNISAQGTINVEDPVLELGIPRNINGTRDEDVMQSVTYGFNLDDNIYDNETGDMITIALEKLEDNYRYPVSSDIVNSMSSYDSTYFVKKVVYSEYRATDTTVFVIKVYDEKNAYGLPSDNNTKCSAVVIYNNSANGFALPADIPGYNSITCSSKVAVPISNFNYSYSGNLGITQVVTNTGAFAFNGQNKFYSLSLTKYTKEGGTTRPASATLNESFYIDSIAPNDTINSVNVYDLKTDSVVTGYSFNQSENIFTLNSTIGSTYAIKFDGVWYTAGNSSDTHENKLMLLSIYGVSGSCNIYQLLTKDETTYSHPCREYVSARSSTTDSEFTLFFEKSAAYTITFVDASDNGVTYEFNIDKEAPIIELDQVYDNDRQISVSPEEENNYVSYTVNSFVGNPRFVVRIEDNSEINSYCYTFFYENVSILTNCVNSSGVVAVEEFIINQSVLNGVLNGVDGNVTLALWAVDSLNNGGVSIANRESYQYLCVEKNVRCANAWIDRKAPTMNFDNKVKLNETILDRNLISDNEANDINYTISISSNDYSNLSSLLCEETEGFSFSDSRYKNGQAIQPYTFIAMCQDVHNTTSTYADDFDNSIYIMFYEVDGDEKGDPFEFGVPTQDGNARKIWIEAVDSVGNISSNHIVLPIIVNDTEKPTVVRVVKANNDAPVTGIEYLYPFAASTELVYLANETMKVEFSEPIAKVTSCVSKVSNVTTGINEGVECSEYSNGTSYVYRDRLTTFTFTAPSDGYFKIVILIVQDFAGEISDRVVLVIDRINPTITFVEHGGDNATLEYGNMTTRYDSRYDYTTHATASDDQSANYTVTTSYQIYSPSVTLHNYVSKKVGNVTTYLAVDDGEPRENNKTYYIRMPKVNAVNRTCNVDPSNASYCYVVDNQGAVYFNSIKTDDSGNYWKNRNSIDETELGVYRIKYLVQDAAGNYSSPIYKLVMVNDTERPDANIAKNDVTLYSNITTTNPNGFNGKLNDAISFVGTDAYGNTNVHLVLYNTTIATYTGNSMVLEQDAFNYSGTGSGALRATSVGSKMNLGLANVRDKVYKVYVYDVGQYLEDDNLDGYILTTNVSSFYCAFITGTVELKYYVHGNTHATGNYNGVEYVYDDINYYIIENGTTRDVNLVSCDEFGTNCVNKSATNAIGYNGIFETIMGNNTIRFDYKDEFNRVVYSVTYEVSNDSELLLHKTYYMINEVSGNITMCNYVNGVNNCSDAEKVYEINRVQAYIYEDGEYHVAFEDQYRNSSSSITLIVDNTPYLINKNNNAPTGVNYWFSVPREIISIDNYEILAELVGKTSNDVIDILDDRYLNNFNSEFFYAFASETEARIYLDNLYRSAIRERLSSGFTFVSIDGSLTPFASTASEDEIMNAIRSRIAAFVYKTQTYTRDGKYFGDYSIKQVPYIAEGIQPMFKYAYIKESRTVLAGNINRGYTYIGGDTCTPADDTETCIKVELKIISNANTSINLDINANVNTITCIMEGVGGAQSSTGEGCNFATVSQTNGATYIFIESDKHGTTNHENFVYYGIIAYRETPKVKVATVGQFIPLNLITTYEKDNDTYVWFNNKEWSLKDVVTTNLYSMSCSFDSVNYENGCIYVEYVSRYKKQGSSTYLPDANGAYYYNYNNEQYYASNSQLSELINDLNLDADYSEVSGLGANGGCSNSTFCQNIPVAIVESQVEDNTILKYTNHKTYIKLFDETNANISLNRIFEVNTIKRNEKYEVYSYSTLTVNETAYNINDYIKVSYSEGVLTYQCVIEVPNETLYRIVVKDRAGNMLTINASHSAIIPDIAYQKVSEDTTSDVVLLASTSSDTASLMLNNVSVYKYAGATLSSTTYTNTTCIGYDDIDSFSLAKELNVTFKYNSIANCAGVYRVVVKDNHENYRYKDFVFNPYDLTTSYSIDLTVNNVREYEEQNTKGVIISNEFSFSIDSSLNYILVYQYPAYSNLELGSLDDSEINIRKITSFISDTNIGSCPISFNYIGDNIYNVFIGETQGDEECDGVYVVEVVNRFSDEVIENGFASLEGASQTSIKQKVTYNEATSIEIDKHAAVTHEDNQARFTVLVDGQETQDANTIIDSANDYTLSYVNKFITIAWGGYKSFSFTSLKYRYAKSENFASELAWNTSSVGVTYDSDFTASYEFKFVEKGVYRCEFTFADAVGNTNEDVYVILISIVPPDVAFYEINDRFVKGRQYEDNQRISTQTIVQCLSVDREGRTTNHDCSRADGYTYHMVVNSVEFPEYGNNYDYITDRIRPNSQWLSAHPLADTSMLRIKLVACIKDKEDICSTINLVIDRKAPTINFDGEVSGTTYIGSVSIMISSEDSTNFARIYRCETIEECALSEVVDERYYYDSIDVGSTQYGVIESYSGYYRVISSDDLGNVSSDWFAIDTEAPTIVAKIKDTNMRVTSNMFTNASVVVAEVNDKMSEVNSKVEVRFSPYLPLNNEEYETTTENGEEIKTTTLQYDALAGLSREGRYVLTPVDGVGHRGRSISFYIYRQSPQYTLYTNSKKTSGIEVDEDGNEKVVEYQATNSVSSEAYITWVGQKKMFQAPLVNVTLDGNIYEYTYNNETDTYTGAVIKSVGEHIFVLTDAAGNRTTIMITINNTNKVCINGVQVDVKMQSFVTLSKEVTVDENGLQTDERMVLFVGGEPGANYANDDVIIFALPSQASGTDCDAAGLLSYRTIDSENSFYWFSSDRNATIFRNNAIDFIKQGFISESAIDEIQNVGGTVIVFVVPKDVANRQLGYHAGTNFFLEDPFGWSIIFVAPLTLIWPAVRLFVKKKVRVI